MNQSPKNLPVNQRWAHLSHLYTLIGNRCLKEHHLLNRLSDNDIQIINDAIRIMRQKFKGSGKQEANLRGRVRDPHSFVGLSSELFWCHWLTQLGYSFDLEAESGGPDFRIELDQRSVNVEVKTLQKKIVSNKESDLNSRLRQAIRRQIKNSPDVFLIWVQVGRNFSNKTIKPLAAIIRRSLLEMSLSQKEVAFTYPAGTYGSYNRQAKVTIKRGIGEKTVISVGLPPTKQNNAKLLKETLDTARKQSGENDVNVVFVDSTFYPMPEDEDIYDALYGKLVHEVSFDQQSREPKSIIPFRYNNGLYHESSRISAVVVYQRKISGMSGIQDANIYPHPESCRLTKAEMKDLKKLSGC